MAPSAVDDYATAIIHRLKIEAQHVVAGKTVSAKLIKEPMQLPGALDNFESFNPTPAIGKEFPEADLAQWLEVPTADNLIRNLAVTGQ